MVKVGSATARGRSWFGDAALLLFLIAQAGDGVLTYVGVTVYGSQMEGNPLIRWLMSALGDGPALTAAKVAACAFGITLHVFAVHKTVALLTTFYFLIAVLPWVTILFLSA
jgi:uncharacterized membrane protein